MVDMFAVLNTLLPCSVDWLEIMVQPCYSMTQMQYCLVRVQAIKNLLIKVPGTRKLIS